MVSKKSQYTGILYSASLTMEYMMNYRLMRHL